MTSFNTFTKRTKNFQKHLAIIDSKKEETVMLQVIKIFNKNTDFLDMTSLNTLIKKTNNFQKHLAILDSKKKKKHLCCKISSY